MSPRAVQPAAQESPASTSVHPVVPAQRLRVPFEKRPRLQVAHASASVEYPPRALPNLPAAHVPVHVTCSLTMRWVPSASRPHRPGVHFAHCPTTIGGTGGRLHRPGGQYCRSQHALLDGSQTVPGRQSISLTNGISDAKRGGVGETAQIMRERVSPESRGHKLARYSVVRGANSNQIGRTRAPCCDVRAFCYRSVFRRRVHAAAQALRRVRPALRCCARRRRPSTCVKPALLPLPRVSERREIYGLAREIRCCGATRKGLERSALHAKRCERFVRALKCVNRHHHVYAVGAALALLSAGARLVAALSSLADRPPREEWPAW